MSKTHMCETQGDNSALSINVIVSCSQLRNSNLKCDEVFQVQEPDSVQLCNCDGSEPAKGSELAATFQKVCSGRVSGRVKGSYK